LIYARRVNGPSRLRALASSATAWRRALALSVLCLAVQAPVALAGIYWSAPSVIASSRLVSLSCPSASLCVGVDTAGAVVSSSAPTAGPAAWSSAAVAASGGLQDVSCAQPAGSLCVAVGPGGIFTSTEPTGGASAWRHVSGSAAPSSVSCPSDGLCVAGDGEEILISTNPEATTAWQLSTLPSKPAFALELLSCASASLCVAAGPNDAGYVLTSAEPAGGASTWKLTHVAEHGFSALSCAATGFCAAVAEETLATSATPAGGSWQVAGGVASLRQIDALSCVSASLCAAAGMDGRLASSGEPADGAGAWEAVEGADGENQISALGCPNEGECLAADEALLTGVGAHRLTVTKTGGGEGEVTSSPIACPFGCTYGASVCPRNCGSSNLSAVLVPQRPQAIACTSTTPTEQAGCALLFPAQETPILTPRALSGSVFVGWSGACGGWGSCTPAMSLDRGVTARFERELRLSSVRQSRRRWRERAGVGAPVGTSFMLHLSRAATLLLRFEVAKAGRRVRGLCRNPSPGNIGGRACVNYLAAGTLTANKPAGASKLGFKGLLSSGRRLRPGVYRVEVAASANGDFTKPVLLAFTISG
jgi:hypothetical protein